MGINLSLKDKLIAKTAEELGMDERLVDTVVNWSYKDTKEASLSYTELELSGFGKLVVSQNKLKKRIDRLEDIKRGTQSKLTQQNEERNWEKRMKSVSSTLELLNKKVVAA